MLKVDGLYVHGSFTLTIAAEASVSTLTAVLGPSGAGKSTLLNVIAGFEPLQSGVVKIDGADVTGNSPSARTVSMVFQDNNVFPHLTLWQNVALGASPSLKLNADERQSVDGALEHAGLQSLAQRKPGEVSGGERQRVALARVLVRKAKVLLLDEPFAALDPGLRRDMLALVKEITATRAMATLLVTHQPEEIRDAADRIIFVTQGETRAFAPSAFFNSQDAAVQTYLGSATKATRA